MTKEGEKMMECRISMTLPDEVKAIRVNPGITTTLREPDIFIGTVTNYVNNGLPS